MRTAQLWGPLCGPMDALRRPRRYDFGEGSFLMTSSTRKSHLNGAQRFSRRPRVTGGAQSEVLRTCFVGPAGTVCERILRADIFHLQKPLFGTLSLTLALTYGGLPWGPTNPLCGPLTDGLGTNLLCSHLPLTKAIDWVPAPYPRAYLSGPH